MIMKMIALVLLSATVSVQLMGVGAFTGISARSHKGHNNIINSKCRGTTEVRASDSEFDIASTVINSNKNNSRRAWLQQQGSTAALSLLLASSTPQSANAAGKDASKKGSGLNVSNQDLSGQDLSKKDFRSAIAQGTNFTDANLQGAQFQGADLVGATFVGADIRGANFDKAVLDKTIFRDANAAGSTFGPTLLDAGDLENVDLTNSVWPSKYRIMICEMPELKGTNPTTGVYTRDSVFCNDRPFSN